MGAMVLHVRGGKGEKRKIRNKRAKLSADDEVPSNIRQVCGTGNTLLAFHEIIQK